MADVVITGASRGIGRALALALTSPTRRLVLVARDEHALHGVATEISARGGDAHTHAADLSARANARTLGVTARWRAAARRSARAQCRHLAVPT